MIPSESTKWKHGNAWVKEVEQDGWYLALENRTRWLELTDANGARLWRARKKEGERGRRHFKKVKSTRMGRGRQGRWMSEREEPRQTETEFTKDGAHTEVSVKSLAARRQLSRCDYSQVSKTLNA